MLNAILDYNEERNGFEIRFKSYDSKNWTWLKRNMNMASCPDKTNGGSFLYRSFDANKPQNKRPCKYTAEQAYNILLERVAEVGKKRPEPKKAKTSKKAKADKPVDLSKLTKAQLIELLQSKNG